MTEGLVDTRFFETHGPFSLGVLLSSLKIEPLETQLLDVEIAQVADLATSRPGDVSFLQSKKQVSALETAKASACLVPSSLAALVGAAGIIPLITETPRAHFGRLIERLFTQKSLLDTGDRVAMAQSGRIHPTAVISKTAKIADDVEISPFVVIGPGVEIGAGTFIGASATIECAIIGENCKIKSQAAIGTRGFGVDADEGGIYDLPHVGRVIIGDRVSVGCHTSIDRGLLGDTVIHNDVKIDNLVQIAHNVTIGEGSMLAGRVGVSGSCVIGKSVLMGGSVGLADHIVVGDGARLAAYAGVMRDIPAGETWSGIPAMPLREHMKVLAASKRLLKKG